MCGAHMEQTVTSPSPLTGGFHSTLHDHDVAVSVKLTKTCHSRQSPFASRVTFVLRMLWALLCAERARTPAPVKHVQTVGRRSGLCVAATVTTPSSDWSYVWLDSSERQCAVATPGSAITDGKAVIVMPDIIGEAECDLILQAGMRAADVQEASLRRRLSASVAEFTANNRRSLGRTRVPISTCSAATEKLFDELFAKILARVDLLPSVAGDLFDAPSLAALHATDSLEFSAREPAFNRYNAGGEFNAHVDRQALTVLIYLTDPDSCQGGGTGFWSAQDSARGAALEDTTAAGYAPPTAVLSPPAGTALIYGGNVMHAGMPVVSGSRSIFLGSFSKKRRDLQLLESD